VARVIKQNPLKIAFGNIVKSRRVYLNLSQEKLAELADLNLSFVSQIERGYRNVGLETIYKLAKALNTNPGSLLP
jgi:transcriptional regulator with XRE-family HTH domain